MDHNFLLADFASKFGIEPSAILDECKLKIELIMEFLVEDDVYPDPDPNNRYDVNALCRFILAANSIDAMIDVLFTPGGFSFEWQENPEVIADFANHFLGNHSIAYVPLENRSVLFHPDVLRIFPVEWIDCHLNSTDADRFLVYTEENDEFFLVSTMSYRDIDPIEENKAAIRKALESGRLMEVCNLYELG